MSRYPFSGEELRRQVHPNSFDLSKFRSRFLKIRVRRFRHLCLLWSYLTFFTKKTFFGPVLVCA